MEHRAVKMLGLIAGATLFAAEGLACSVTGIVANTRLVEKAGSKVRARTVEYSRQPSDPGIRTTGAPDSSVLFKVLETVRGEPLKELSLPGYLVSNDDFNDRPSPYTFVRPGGRSGKLLRELLPP